MLSGGCHTVGDDINTEKLYLNLVKCCFELPSSALCAATLYPHRCFVFVLGFFSNCKRAQSAFLGNVLFFYDEHHTLKHQGLNHYSHFCGF